jgi:hypothetical protein
MNDRAEASSILREFLRFRGLYWGNTGCAWHRRRVCGRQSFPMTVENDPQKIGIKFFQNIIGAVVGKIDAAISEDTANRTILFGVVSRRNALLQQLTQDLRSVKGLTASVGARDHRARGCVPNARPRCTISLSEVARIVFQHMRQKAKYEKS